MVIFSEIVGDNMSNHYLMKKIKVFLKEKEQHLGTKVRSDLLLRRDSRYRIELHGYQISIFVLNITLVVGEGIVGDGESNFYNISRVNIFIFSNMVTLRNYHYTTILSFQYGIFLRFFNKLGNIISNM